MISRTLIFFISLLAIFSARGFTVEIDSEGKSTLNKKTSEINSVPFDLPTSGIKTVKKIIKKYDCDSKWNSVSGDVYYLDIFEGKGRLLQNGSAAHMQIRGWDENGRMIENTFNAETWFIFTYGMPGAVFPGFHDGIQGMREGGKRLIIIPSHMAYGDKGYKDSETLILPDTDLIIEASLMWIRKPELEKVRMFK